MRFALVLAGLLLGGAVAAQRPAPPARPDPDAGVWTAAGRDPGLTRFSPLDLISRENVRELRPVWSFGTGSQRGHEGSPLVIGAVMYVHTPYPGAVFALDLGRPGAPGIWTYQPPYPGTGQGAARVPATMPTGCCDAGSRGLAYHPSGKLYVPLFQGELAALDAATGRELWRVRNAEWQTGASLGGAPLVAGDLVLIGVSGAEYGVRGHLSAYDARSGRLVWRGYSTGPDADVLLEGPGNPAYPSHRGRDLGVASWPGESWRQGGGTTSGWLSHDAELGLVYHGTDQPAPANPAQRPGDNKWTASIFAREVRTGRVRWVYQLTPHDEWGYGGANENLLVDLTVRGAPVKALVHFDRNGFAYTLDRATGRLLLAEKYGPANWASAIDLATGVPLRDPRYAAPAPGAAPAAGVCPGRIGTKYLQPAAFSPRSGLFYAPLNNLCMELRTAAASFVAGRPYGGASVRMSAGPGGMGGRVIAWNAATAALAWEIREPLAVSGGALATAGGLLFYGTLDGWLKAVDQETGRELWKFKTPSGILGAPISYLGPDGQQYIAVLSGTGGWWGLGADGAYREPATQPGGTLLVFGR